MSREILIAPLTAEAFAPYGEVLEATGDPDKIINQGLCGRFHDRATLDIVEGRAGISLFKSEARSLPYVLDMVERHPLGSQAFLPMSLGPVPRDRRPRRGRRPRHAAGVPHLRRGRGSTSTAAPGTAFSPRSAPPGLFAVIDRIGEGANLQEHWFDTPWTVRDA
jgi:ureidoglycolate lyase